MSTKKKNKYRVSKEMRDATERVRLCLLGRTLGSILVSSDVPDCVARELGIYGQHLESEIDTDTMTTIKRNILSGFNYGLSLELNDDRIDTTIHYIVNGVEHTILVRSPSLYALINTKKQKLDTQKLEEAVLKEYPHFNENIIQFEQIDTIYIRYMYVLSKPILFLKYFNGLTSELASRCVDTAEFIQVFALSKNDEHYDNGRVLITLNKKECSEVDSLLQTEYGFELSAGRFEHVHRVYRNGDELNNRLKSVVMDEIRKIADEKKKKKQDKKQLAYNQLREMINAYYGMTPGQITPGVSQNDLEQIEAPTHFDTSQMLQEDNIDNMELYNDFLLDNIITPGEVTTPPTPQVPSGTVGW